MARAICNQRNTEEKNVNTSDDHTIMSIGATLTRDIGLTA